MHVLSPSQYGLIVADYYYSLYMVCLVWQRYGEARRYLRWAASILETMEGDSDSEQLKPHLAILRYVDAAAQRHWRPPAHLPPRIERAGSTRCALDSTELARLRKMNTAAPPLAPSAAP